MTHTWKKNGKLVVDAGGHPIECDICPCGPPGPALITCCPDGSVILPNVYIWWYMGTNIVSGVISHTCMPNPCADGGKDSAVWGDQYRFVGQPSFGSFSWAEEDTTWIGSIGCFTLRIISHCYEIDGFDIFGNPTVSFEYQLSIDIDFNDGLGYRGRQIIGNGGTADGTPCILSVFECGVYDGGHGGPGYPVAPTEYFLTTRDPATGILCPDGTVVPTDFTVNITLNNALGVPTLYSCTVEFSPRGSTASASCYAWTGQISDCTSSTHCSRIEFYYGALSDAPGGGTGDGFLLYYLDGPVSFGSFLYADVPLPIAGNAVQDAQPTADCGSGPTPAAQFLWSTDL